MLSVKVKKAFAKGKLEWLSKMTIYSIIIILAKHKDE